MRVPSKHMPHVPSQQGIDQSISKLRRKHQKHSAPVALTIFFCVVHQLSLGRGAGLSLQHELFDWRTLSRALWNTHGNCGAFCLGKTYEDAEALMLRSFPANPAELSSDSDGLCGNITALLPHLCGPTELDFYFRYLLLTDNPEQVPSSFSSLTICDVGSSSGMSNACAPGFFQTAQVPELPGPGHVNPELGAAKPCCPGFFCPNLLTCMIPCPLGAYCPRCVCLRYSYHKHNHSLHNSLQGTAQTHTRTQTNAHVIKPTLAHTLVCCVQGDTFRPSSVLHA